MKKRTVQQILGSDRYADFEHDGLVEISSHNIVELYDSGFYILACYFPRATGWLRFLPWVAPYQAIYALTTAPKHHIDYLVKCGIGEGQEEAVQYLTKYIENNENAGAFMFRFSHCECGDSTIEVFNHTFTDYNTWHRVDYVLRNSTNADHFADDAWSTEKHCKSEG